MRTPCTDVRTLLTETTEHAARFLESFPERPVVAPRERWMARCRAPGCWRRRPQPDSTRDADRHRPHGAPEITVVAGGQVYATLFKALGRLVLGHDRAVLVPAEAIDE